ncbi:50S ribosomal protein L21 [Coriobacteriia bacterium Es71-Z0120]|uniref:50S ribosomal protein L21 n=1 Tax=Parvivirga hydrogeniphila TaxID=2939460 RepID=UPI002260D7EB|nr:50S ribosomal protein L21 [Parvivirga hydrogeniphila]MCL4078971.1 50S ribosomal protein L21 [Parvivirga hydrogeniphila]
MYAVVKTGGKQLVVEKDAVAVVEKIDAPVGESVTLPALMVVDGDTVLVGSDAAKARVSATVVEHFLGEKQIVFKFKRRKGYKRTKGHRQPQTALLITDVSVEAPKKRATKKSEARDAEGAAEASPKKRTTKKSEPAAEATVEVAEE